MRKRLRSFIFFLFLLSGAVCAQPTAADLVVINAQIRTMDKTNPVAEALAATGGRIITVGKTREIRPLIGDRTRVIDAGGKLVLPGFNDSHVHFMGIGNEFFSIDLSRARSPEDVREKIRYYTEYLPPGSWILGGRWDSTNWTPNALPSKELIDDITPEHPVFIYNASPDTVLVNSLALKKAGIGKNSKDFSDGRILRDETGEPTGILKGQAIRLVKRHVPLLATGDRAAVARTASNYAASHGVTSVQDVHSDDNTGVFRELAQNGELKTRIYDCTPLPKWREIARAGITRAAGDDFVRTGCLKHFSDGDYAILPELTSEFIAADRAGLQITIHAIGSRANDIVLTAFERVSKSNGAKDRRLMIEHAHNIRPQDIARFGRAHIIASMQPHLFWGGEPYRSLLRSGAVLAFGSDAPITELNPLYGIHAAVNRGSAAERLSVSEAVYAYTVGSAYAEFQEDEKGSLTAGKLADLIILSDDIFLIEPEKIRNARVLMTIVDGRIVYDREQTP